MEAQRLLRFFEFVYSLVLLIVDAICLGFSNLLPVNLKRKKDVQNELVLITGGGSGFGQSLAVKFAQLGCEVVIWDVDEAGCRETISKVRREVSDASTVHSYIVDVSDRLKVYETAKRVKTDVGEVTILVNNAGIGLCHEFLGVPDNLIEKVMNVNCLAHFWTLKAFLPNMIENNHGHLVSISSMAGVMSLQMAAAYSASKHAAIGLMDSLTWDLIESGKTNVKTTVVCPYFTATTLFQCEYDGLLPILDPEDVSATIMEGILTEKDVVYVPRSFCLSGLLKTVTTKRVFIKLCQLIVGEAIAKTMKLKTVFEEQRNAENKNQ